MPPDSDNTGQQDHIPTTAALALRGQSVGWDGAGDWSAALVLGDYPPSKRQPWPTYKPLARFKSAADAQRVADALTALRKAVDDRRVVPTTGVESAALAVLEAFDV